jgi:hypothetical protein
MEFQLGSPAGFQLFLDKQYRQTYIDQPARMSEITNLWDLELSLELAKRYWNSVPPVQHMNVQIYP